MIVSEAALDSLIERLAAASPVRYALDTEADSLHSYREKLCLIQLGCSELLAIIDPLKIDSAALEKLLRFLSTEEVWFHGADFDMTLLSRTYGFLPERVFDTQLAARLLGRERFGLADLIESHFSVKLSKSAQKADWGARPISPKMLTYAFDDVRYLLPLIEIFTQELKDRGRWDWFVQWCETSRHNVLQRKERSPEDIWRVPGWGNLSSKALVYLREIWFWRDKESQRRDRPPFRLMNNQTMLKLAQRAGEGHPVRGSRGLNSEQSKRLRAVLAQASRVPKDQWPERRRVRSGPKEEYDTDAYQRLRNRRNSIASSLGIDPTVIATRAALEQLANSEEKADAVLMLWQKTLLFPEPKA